MPPTYSLWQFCLAPPVLSAAAAVERIDTISTSYWTSNLTGSTTHNTELTRLGQIQRGHPFQFVELESVVLFPVYVRLEYQQVSWDD